MTKLDRRKDIRQPLTLPKTSHASRLPPERGGEGRGGEGGGREGGEGGKGQ